MPPIMMSWRERAALRRLARGALPAEDIRPQYAQKLVKHGLVVRETLRLKITAKGQLELLRQRYRNMPTRTVTVTEEDFRTQFSRGLREIVSDRAEDQDPTERLPG
jgi:hypothetical protein